MKQIVIDLNGVKIEYPIKDIYKATTHEITLNPQDSTKYLTHLNQIKTIHIDTNTKNSFFMMPINIVVKKIKKSNHTRIRLVAQKKNQ